MNNMDSYGNKKEIKTTTIKYEIVVIYQDEIEIPTNELTNEYSVNDKLAEIDLKEEISNLNSKDIKEIYYEI